MTDQHPINPPPELIAKWAREFYGTAIAPGEASIAIATQAARWGADQELEACCEWLRKDLDAYELVGLRAVYLDHNLHNARRPKPPSLKEQSLALIDKIQGNKEMWQTDELNDEMTADFELLRQAVLQLPD